MKPASQLKKDIVSACRVLSHESLVKGFGHVSARIPESDLFLITPRISLALVRKRDLLTMNLKGEVIEGNHPAPFEAWLHTAIMKAKPGVNAITRIHARVANIFSVTERKLEPVHNHGSFFSGGVPVLATPDLISTEALGNEVADALGTGPAVLLRGNGQVTVGRTIPEAVMMAIYLEEAAEILYGALQIGTPIPLTSTESAQRQIEALPPVDMERAWNFFKERAGSR
ncbi:MAG: class II aldolase/adducin family protein [Candidatus Binatia bacterium]